MALQRSILPGFFRRRAGWTEALDREADTKNIGKNGCFHRNFSFVSNVPFLAFSSAGATMNPSSEGRTETCKHGKEGMEQ